MSDLEGFSQCTMDPKMVSEIQANQAMSNEQGSGFMSRWGGPETYKVVANMPESDRIVYMGYLKGFENAQEISEVTGVDIKEVNKSLRALGRQGFVQDYKSLVYEPKESLEVI